jgi:hypothetical protein
MIIPLDEPELLFLLVCLEEYEEPDEGFGVVEIVETDERDEPLTGTAGIEYRVDDFEERLALFLVLRLAVDFLAVERLAAFLTLRLAVDFLAVERLAVERLAAFFFAAT